MQQQQNPNTSQYTCPHSCYCQPQPAPQPQTPPAPPKKRKRAGKIIGSFLLAALIFCAGGITHYFSLDSEIRALMQVKKRVQKEYYEQITDEQFYGAMFGGINGILDAYSGYLSPDEFQKILMQATGQQIGMGLSFYANATPEEALRVVQVSGNSPAERLGILPGERIVGYGADENSLQTTLTFDAFSAFLSDYSAGEEFYLRIQSNTGAERNVRIARENYLASYVTYRTRTNAYRFVDGNALQQTTFGQPLTVLDTQTAYICLTGFNGKAAEEFAMAMTAFQRDGMKNLVLDLRGNGGGYLNTMLQIAEYLGKNAPAGAVAAIADYGEKQENFCIKNNVYGEYFHADSRVTVLADSGTASASECLIGYMYDYGTIDYADICLSQRGEEIKTFGKGIMQTTYPLLLTGGAIKVTTAKIIWPVSRHCIHGRGVLPADGALQVSENADREEELKAAISVLFH